MGTFTGLTKRGPAAGFATVFPDGWGQRWDGEQRDPRRAGVDDPAFISGLVHHLTAAEVARPGAVIVVGLSNGALFAEFLARHAVLKITLLALVSGTTSEQSRRTCPRPEQAAAVVCFAGTSDQVMPYLGGRIGGSGLVGRMTDWRAHRRRSDRPVAVAAETLAEEWAAANGIETPPSVEPVPGPSGLLSVTLLSWTADGHLPVALYRLDGGGHGWPGGPQYLPARAVGLISRLDATGIILGLAKDLVADST
jgi:polyhydroxybutyrate depolymerase